MNPLVSIIIPVYNGERFVGRAIECALGQTYTNIEVIVVDDGSTDGTAETVRAFQDPRVRYIYQKNARQGVARNNGIRNCKGEYITFLDADDQYLPEKVEREVRFLLANRELKVVYCRPVWFFTSQPGVYYRRPGRPPEDALSGLLETSLVNLNCLMIHRTVTEKAGLFNETRYYPEDWEFCLRIALAAFVFGYLDEALVIVELKRDTDLPFEKQWEAKVAAVEMFRRLMPGPVTVGGKIYDASLTIRKLNLKVAIGYLLVRRKDDFLRTFRGVYPSRGIVKSLMARILMALPPALIKNMWILYRRWNSEKTENRTLSVATVHSNERAAAKVSASVEMSAKDI